MKAIILIISMFFNVSAEKGVLTEKQKIDLLISYVEGMNATFIRNGDTHTNKDAAKFLRKKYERKADEIKTARDFIAKCASVSSRSGDAYQIKFADGKMMTTSEVLTKELLRLESCSK